MGADRYDKIEEVNQCSVIWIEKNDTFLRNVNHSSVKFNYAEREYVWSELVYTPVKIFVFKDNSVELIPTFGEEK